MPAKITREMQRAYFDSIDKHMKLVETSAYFGRHTNNEIAYGEMLSASPYIDGVPVEVVANLCVEVRMAEMAARGVRYDGAGWARVKAMLLSSPDEYDIMPTAVMSSALRAAGIKVADND